MKRIFQIVTKGVASNKLELWNFDDYLEFKKALNMFRNNPRFLVITINQIV